MADFGVALFHTTSAAMRAERVLLRAAMGAKLVPVPRDLSSDCGLALRFAWDQVDRVRAVLADAGVEVAGLHPTQSERTAKGADRPSPNGGALPVRAQGDVIPDVDGAVVVAMSGGVDSAVTAALLAREGRRVVGVTLRIWSERWPTNPERRNDRCCSVGAAADARVVADRLGIPHYVVDCEEEFEREVIQPFVAAYRRAETPNPCLACNSRLKFGSLRIHAKGWGASHVATGHYARVDQDSRGWYRLRRGVDPRKDQSYFLYELTQEQLGGALFPIGHLRKEDTRRLAREWHLPVAEKPESQEICFVGGDYRAYLQARVGGAIASGTIRDTSGVVRGQHAGVAHYTIGQRHGLGISTPSPLYVVALDAGRNEVVVGEERDLFSGGVDVGRVHLNMVEPPQGPKPILVKLRSTQAAIPAELTPVSMDRVRLRFDEPQRAVAPGQAAVFYAMDDCDLVLGGGTILGCDPCMIHPPESRGTGRLRDENQPIPT